MENHLPQLTSIVISAHNNPIAPQNLLGVVLRKEHNAFVGQSSVIIVFENRQFAEFFASDIGEEIELTDYSYPPLDGVDFSDSNITECIKNGVFETVFNKIREKLEKAA